MKHLFFVFQSPKCNIKSIDRSDLISHELYELTVALLLTNIHALVKTWVVEALCVVKGKECAHWPLVIRMSIVSLVLLAFLGRSEKIG